MEAIGAFQEAQRADPADVEIVNNLGYAYLLNNDLDSAERYVLTALTMQPGRSAGWGNLGQIYAKKKEQIPSAVARFTNAYRFSRDLNKTHSYFLGLMEKENDLNLRQALRQATEVGERKFVSAGANVLDLDIKSNRSAVAQDVQTNQERSAELSVGPMPKGDTSKYKPKRKGNTSRHRSKRKGDTSRHRSKRKGGTSKHKPKRKGGISRHWSMEEVIFGS